MITSRDVMMKIANFLLATAILLQIAMPAEAQHPIDVQRLAAKGSYFEALRAYQKLPKRRSTTEASVSAAKSAWALGLPEMATEEFDRALGDDALPSNERALILLSKGIIEFQEGRYRMASVFAERASKLIAEPSHLRGRIWLLWAESLFGQEQYPAAEDKYRLALEEAKSEEHPSVNFYLGLCRLRLGRPEEARRSFEAIPLESEHAPAAVRHLAQIALDEANMDSAAFWLDTGREQFPDSFLDSWVDYALLRIAVHNKDHKKARAVRERALAKYAPSDHWLVLLEAAAEAFEWEIGRGAQAIQARES